MDCGEVFKDSLAVVRAGRAHPAAIAAPLIAALRELQRAGGVAHARRAPAAAPRPRAARPLVAHREGPGPPWWRGRCGRCWRRCGRAGASCRRAGTCIPTSSSRHPRSWQVRRAPGTGWPRAGSRGREAARARAPRPASPAGRAFPRDPALPHGQSRKPGRTGSAGLAGFPPSCCAVRSEWRLEPHHGNRLLDALWK